MLSRTCGSRRAAAIDLPLAAKCDVTFRRITGKLSRDEFTKENSDGTRRQRIQQQVQVLRGVRAAARGRQRREGRHRREDPAAARRTKDPRRHPVENGRSPQVAAHERRVRRERPHARPVQEGGHRHVRRRVEDPRLGEEGDADERLQRRQAPHRPPHPRRQGRHRRGRHRQGARGADRSSSRPSARPRCGPPRSAWAT